MPNKMLAATALKLYLVSLIWICLHPFISVTTGELKPRSLFIDEHSIPSASKVITDDMHNAVEKQSLSLPIDLINYCISNITKVDSTSAWKSCHFQPLHTPLLLETTLMTFILPRPSIKDSNNFYINFIAEIIGRYRSSRWVAKSLTLLLNTTNISNSSTVDISHLTEQGDTCGLVREAYIFDLSQLPPSSSSSLAFDVINLDIHGSHGHLPNMDLISYIRHVLYEETQIAPCQHSSYFKPYITQVVNFLDLNNDAESRVFGFINHICSSAFTRNTVAANLQSAFLQHNIDTITLQPIQTTLYKQQAKYNERDFIRVVMQLLYMSSSLEEELHHSYSQYILLGDHHFLGLNEFGGSAMTLLLAYFMLLLSHWPNVKPSGGDAGSVLGCCAAVLFLALSVLAANHVAWIYLVAIPIFPFVATMSMFVVRTKKPVVKTVEKNEK